MYSIVGCFEHAYRLVARSQQLLTSANQRGGRKLCSRSPAGLWRISLARFPAQDYHAADNEGRTEDSLPVHFLPEKYSGE